MRASTTHLLNTVERFDVLHVLERVPAHWPVHDLERFLVRALQQLQHNRRHLQVIKAAAHAENADMLATLAPDTVRALQPADSHSTMGGLLQDADSKDVFSDVPQPLDAFASPEKGQTAFR